jgi:hypothetical protein
MMGMTGKPESWNDLKAGTIYPKAVTTRKPEYPE